MRWRVCNVMRRGYKGLFGIISPGTRRGSEQVSSNQTCNFSLYLDLLRGALFVDVLRLDDALLEYFAQPGPQHRITL